MYRQRENTLTISEELLYKAALLKQVLNHCLRNTSTEIKGEDIRIYCKYTNYIIYYFSPFLRFTLRPKNFS